MMDTDVVSIPIEQALEKVKSGDDFYKVRSTTKFFRRQYKVDMENMRLCYSPSKKSWFCSTIPYVDLCDVVEVRRGRNTDRFNAIETKIRKLIQKGKLDEPAEHFPQEEKCLSIVFENKSKTVDLVADSKEVRNTWLRALDHLIAKCSNEHDEHEYDKWLREQFKKADTNKNRNLKFSECERLIFNLNIAMDKKTLREFFLAADERKIKIDGEAALDVQEFQKLFHNLNARDDLKSIFDNYLLGDQLIGSSSIEAYVRALEKGCRCLELDVWDGENDEPIIYHGYTLTSKILLRDVLEAIRYYAFKASPYPLILSIENHLSLDQQVTMATYFEAILGDYLHKEAVKEDEIRMPSPEDLREKILIKGKKLSEDIDEREEEKVKKHTEEKMQQMSELSAMSGHSSGSNLLQPSPVKFRTFLNRMDYSDDGSFKDDKRLPNEIELETPAADDVPDAISFPAFMAPSAKSKGPKVAPELSDLITYCRAHKFKSFEDCKKWEFCEMASFSEKKAEELATNEPQKFIEHNEKHLSRIYPKGARTNSSNYSPLAHWAVGAQLVALNYQTMDKPVMTNEALFAQNGRCGYVLKPNYMRSGASTCSAQVGRLRLNITVVTGQTMPKGGQGDGGGGAGSVGEVIDPYVTIKIYGHPSDKQKVKTNSVRNNGFNPSWENDTGACFELVVSRPEVAFLEFAVKDQSATGKNAKLAGYILPVSSVTQGYRHVHLKDNKGQEVVAASLFVHVLMSKLEDEQ